MKKRNKKYTPRPKSWAAIQIALLSASKEAQSDEVHRWLATEAYASLEKLTKGLLDDHGFRSLTKLNAFGYLLAVEVYPGLDDESQQEVAKQKDVIIKAANALTSIGQRNQRTGAYGATGPELNAIRHSFALMDTLTGFANRGESVRAMMKADAMVNEVTKELEECT